MIQNFNTLTVLDLKEMFTKIKVLDGEDPVAELIEISEGFETAISQYGVEEPQDHDRLLVLLGLAWEMERRMKKIEARLERIHFQVQGCSVPHPRVDLMDVVHRVPGYSERGIIE
jgi:hypothetical protein